jgi:hypothetical protein
MRTVLVSTWLVAVSSVFAFAGEPVALRMEMLRVAPMSQPLLSVQVRNLQEVAYQGTLRLKPPADWRIATAERAVSLAPGETQRVAFAVEKGVGNKENRYAMEMDATGAGVTVTRRQEVFCATAPYFKPTIDGDPADWQEALPVTFVCSGKRTGVSTYWNRKEFAMLVAVEEASLRGYTAGAEPSAFDAVQVAISPVESSPAARPEEPSGRYEFLFAGAGPAPSGKCFRLADPEAPLAETQKRRPLAGLEYSEAQVRVSRREGVTYYEASLPFAPMKSRIRPSEGREFFLSVLVHDPDGTGVRDLGESAGLGPSQRSPLSWSRWPGAQWPAQPPFDCRVEWGLSSSRF